MTTEQKEQLERCLKICEKNLKNAYELTKNNFNYSSKIFNCYKDVTDVLNTIEV